MDFHSEVKVKNQYFDQEIKLVN